MIKKTLLFYVIAALTIFIGTPAAQSDGLGIDTLINKSHSLQPRDYAPPSLVVPAVLLAKQPADPEMQLAPPAREGLTSLFKAAQSDSISLVLASGYRPYEDQVVLYNTNLKADETTAQESVARPGYSEHQSGLAADVITSDYFCAAEGCFALSKAAAWLSQNSYQYGFIVRYPPYKEASTGYEYEPWHIRYVGIPLAVQLHQKQETLEEFYGLP